ncbi:hypothetical protein Taro_010558 [Colocasia esculenta]|uniref:Uncharacterized protein n=1 Tax=Colocasia esculenta TaxID=4460 RepID=A0A843U3C9_COLES|nr:hypothetical protein [Colocasia esculenta]
MAIHPDLVPFTAMARRWWSSRSRTRGRVSSCWGFSTTSVPAPQEGGARGPRGGSRDGGEEDPESVTGGRRHSLEDPVIGVQVLAEERGIAGDAERGRRGEALLGAAGRLRVRRQGEGPLGSIQNSLTMVIYCQRLHAAELDPGDLLELHRTIGTMPALNWAISRKAGWLRSKCRSGELHQSPLLLGLLEGAEVGAGDGSREAPRGVAAPDLVVGAVSGAAVEEDGAERRRHGAIALSEHVVIHTGSLCMDEKEH